MLNIKVKKEQQSRLYRDAIARKIANTIIVLQGRIVRLLERWDHRLSITQKKALLLIFCLVSSAYCSYLFFSAVSGNANVASSFGHVPPVNRPPPVTRPKDSIQKLFNQQ